MFTRFRRRRSKQAPAVDVRRTPTLAPFGFTGQDGEESLDRLDPDALLEWENRGVPSVRRASDRAEAISDEKQDRTSGLNFPLHWTTARESWDYLFDFAIACELLAPRPDDLVLDLAAGTCWATEFLNRLGVRPVAIDLSVELMRRGRERLAADSRLVFRGDAGFVAARGQALPFRDETFDGVLCMNALHHHPSYAAALGEIYRVLRPGGRAVFSEPGTAHAEQPLSQYRMREESVMEKPVSLPLVHHLAAGAGFSRMRVVPLRAASTYAFDYRAAADDGRSLEEMWRDTLLHSPREHARFVLHKGDDAPLDSLQPSHRLVGQLSYSMEPLRMSSSVAVGQTFTDRLRIHNSGGVIWKARGRRFGGQVTCGVKVCRRNGEVLREDLGRTPLPQDVPPGGDVVLDITIAGELGPGHYELRYDMVIEGVTWFEFQGGQCLRHGLEVRGA